MFADLSWRSQDYHYFANARIATVEPAISDYKCWVLSRFNTDPPLQMCCDYHGRALPFSNVHPAFVTQLVSGKIG